MIRNLFVAIAMVLTACVSTHSNTQPVATTPPGITLKSLEQKVSDSQTRELLVFADQQGRTIYTSDTDARQGSLCTGAAAGLWIPLTTATERDAKPTAGWSLLKCPGGKHQWAYRGHPAYTYSKEGDDRTEQERSRLPDPYYRRLGAAPVALSTTSGDKVDGHHVAELKPMDWTTVPMGISIQEARAASGQVLTNDQGMILYVADHGVTQSEINSDWAPVKAPFIARPIGEFNIIARTDGTQQWAFRDQALFTYQGDWRVGDVNGPRANPRLKPAYIVHYFMPDTVTVRRNSYYGGLLTTRDDRTLYALEIRHDGADDGIRNDRGDLVTGTRIGLKGCNSVCERAFVPFIAPADAQPSGYWSVYPRPDGQKQWAYYGYALYTFGADRPGQINGNLVYEASRDLGTAQPEHPQIEVGLRWRVVPP